MKENNDIEKYMAESTDRTMIRSAESLLGITGSQFTLTLHKDWFDSPEALSYRFGIDQRKIDTMDDTLDEIEKMMYELI